MTGLMSKKKSNSNSYRFGCDVFVHQLMSFRCVDVELEVGLGCSHFGPPSPHLMDFTSQPRFIKYDLLAFTHRPNSLEVSQSPASFDPH
jgi:hypothetical protein